MKQLLLAAFITCIIPFAVVGMILSASDITKTEQEQVFTTDPIRVAEKMVLVKTETGIQPISMENYILCVVLAEMPADFEIEALKAQAIVARTFTCRKMEQSKHENFDVCTEYACCQAYCSQSDYLSNGGSRQSVDKVRKAVAETAGLVITYEGSLIDATYFSCSGGRTEDAKEVWGGEVPYLQSVESPGEEHATHYLDTISFDVTEFCDKLDIAIEDFMTLSIRNITYTEGGGVKTIEIGGITFKGTQIRQYLGLRSTAFSISVTHDQIIVTTNGFGHRVGMSQYGADAMALQGYNYEDILHHYYRGTMIVRLSG